MPTVVGDAVIDAAAGTALSPWSARPKTWTTKTRMDRTRRGAPVVTKDHEIAAFEW